MSNDENISDLVQREVAEALGRPRMEIQEEAWLKADLGAESIDLIDLTFRFEKALGRPLMENEIYRSSRPDGDFTVAELVRALERVRGSDPAP